MGKSTVWRNSIGGRGGCFEPLGLDILYAIRLSVHVLTSIAPVALIIHINMLLYNGQVIIHGWGVDTL